MSASGAIAYLTAGYQQESHHMKAGKTLQELAAEIQRQMDAKKDFIAPLAQIELVATGPGKTALLLGAKPSMATDVIPLDRRQGYDVGAVAHAQLAESVGIPKPYYDRCLAEAPELLAGDVNHWLRKMVEDAKAPPKKLVRTLDGNVRALLSDRYRPLDNFALCEAVLPVIAEQELFIASMEITGRRLYIKAFDKKIEREIKLKGTDAAHTFLTDVVFPSITISNSEVGYGSLSIAAGIYTGGCTNFASFSDSRMRKYHLGGKALDSEEIYALLSDETKAVSDKAIWLQTRDVVRSAFEIARFEERVARVQETTEQRIEGEVLKVVEVVGQQFSFSKEERGSVLKHLIEGGSLTRYGLFNAITRTAEDLPDYDRATEFERAGGELIELPSNQWERLAKAA